MATEVKRISCPAGVYTLLCDNKTKFACKLATIGVGRLAIAASLPAPTNEDYVTIVSSRPGPAFSDLVAGDKVYFRPDGATAIVVEVIRG